MDTGRYLKMYLVALISMGCTAASAWLSHKLGFPVHIAVPLIVTPVLIGLKLLAHHWHMDYLEAAFEPSSEDLPAPASAPKPSDASSVVAKLLLIGFLFAGLSGCRYVDEKALKEFQTDDASMMVELGKYLDADAAAGKKTADAISAEKLAISKHNAQVVADVRSVDPAEEQGLVAEFLAYVQSDPKATSGLKKAWSNVAQEHLALFASVHR